MSENKMHFPYLPATPSDRESMLKDIGVRAFEDLVSHIPAEVRLKDLDMQDGLSEMELSQLLSELANKNKPASRQFSFLGGGSYRRFVPAVVPAIISRSEFATAYTPYQPEVSQGSLQAIYEFQTAVCLLTGMDVANASMYDGPTACAEAAMMAVRLTGRKKIVISAGVNPEYRMVTETYANTCGLGLTALDVTGGISGQKDLTGSMDTDVACLIVQYPNFFGGIEELDKLAQLVHNHGGLLVVVSDPISLGLLTAPGDLGADIVVGDAQSCGNFLSFGGPSAGYMATRKDFIRQLPGRLAGMTTDNRGQTAFTLTLQTREQHIRRANATSNICTNQALNALAMLVYLTCMGPQGLKELATISVQRAHYLAEKLSSVAGVKLTFDMPFFNEFAITLPESVNAASVLDELKERGILGGIDLSLSLGLNCGASATASPAILKNSVLVAVTEMNSPQELDRYAEVLAEVLSQTVGGTKAGNSAKKILTV